MSTGISIFGKTVRVCGSLLEIVSLNAVSDALYCFSLDANFFGAHENHRQFYSTIFEIKLFSKYKF